MMRKKSKLSLYHGHEGEKMSEESVAWLLLPKWLATRPFLLLGLIDDRAGMQKETERRIHCPFKLAIHYFCQLLFTALFTQITMAKVNYTKSPGKSLKETRGKFDRLAIHGSYLHGQWSFLFFFLSFSLFLFLPLFLSSSSSSPLLKSLLQELLLGHNEHWQRKGRPDTDSNWSPYPVSLDGLSSSPPPTNFWRRTHTYTQETRVITGSPRCSLSLKLKSKEKVGIEKEREREMNERKRKREKERKQRPTMTSCTKVGKGIKKTDTEKERKRPAAVQGQSGIANDILNGN